MEHGTRQGQLSRHSNHKKPMTTINDERTPTELQTHPIVWLGTDSFMSGWGGAEGGASYAGWACRPEDAHVVERWVRARGDLLRVREVSPGYRPSGDHCSHCHIYVVGPNHPALGGA